MKFIKPMIVAAVALTTAGMASAQFAKPDDAIKYRKSAMFVMQQHFGRIGAMASGKAPFNAKAAADNAEVAEFMSKLPWAGFTPDSDMGNTSAKVEIWKEPGKFKEKADKLQADMMKLTAAAKTGNLDSIKSAFQTAAGTCKSCHDAYKEK